jgi:putative ABC transport system ATP-binding protein
MMYTIQRLTKTYNSRRGTVTALDSISLEIGHNSFIAVTGGSGSGKTTLLLALGGLIRPSSGTILFDDKDLYRNSTKDLATFRNLKVGFVLQTFNLIPYLSALENVMLPMLIAPRNNGDAQIRGQALLARLGLTDRQEHLPRELSVGQQQRVAIARALANNPDVILADEPTGNLDPLLSEEILDILESLYKEEKKTVVMVTHSPSAAKRAEKIIRLTKGAVEP